MNSSRVEICRDDVDLRIIAILSSHKCGDIGLAQACRKLATFMDGPGRFESTRNAETACENREHVIHWCNRLLLEHRSGMLDDRRASMKLVKFVLDLADGNPGYKGQDERPKAVTHDS